MDEELMRERYALAKERIAEIKTEQGVPEPFRAFFQKTAAFLLQTIAVMDETMMESGSDASADGNESAGAGCLWMKP